MDRGPWTEAVLLGLGLGLLVAMLNGRSLLLSALVGAAVVAVLLMTRRDR